MSASLLKSDVSEKSFEMEQETSPILLFLEELGYRSKNSGKFR